MRCSDFRIGDFMENCCKMYVSFYVYGISPHRPKPKQLTFTFFFKMIPLLLQTNHLQLFFCSVMAVSIKNALKLEGGKDD